MTDKARFNVRVEVGNPVGEISIGDRMVNVGLSDVNLVAVPSIGSNMFLEQCCFENCINCGEGSFSIGEIGLYIDTVGPARVRGQIDGHELKFDVMTVDSIKKLMEMNGRELTILVMDKELEEEFDI